MQRLCLLPLLRRRRGLPLLLMLLRLVLLSLILLFLLLK
jgi:hypothetical protein